MTIYIGIALAVCIIGILMYVLCTNGKLSEIGRIAYAVGLLVCLWQAGAHLIR
jgi:hypothetical protein